MYSIETVKKSKKKLTICRVVMYSLIGVAVLTTVLCLLFMKEEHETIFKIGLSVVDVFLFLGVAFIASYIIPSTKTEKRHIEMILQCDEEFIDARITAVKNGPITLSNGVSVYEIELSIEGKTRIVRLESSGSPDSFEIGNSYHFVLANNFVKEWRPL